MSNQKYRLKSNTQKEFEDKKNLKYMKFKNNFNIMTLFYLMNLLLI